MRKYNVYITSKIASRSAFILFLSFLLFVLHVYFFDLYSVRFDKRVQVISQMASPASILLAASIFYIGSLRTREENARKIMDNWARNFTFKQKTALRILKQLNFEEVKQIIKLEEEDNLSEGPKIIGKNGINFHDLLNTIKVDFLEEKANITSDNLSIKLADSFEFQHYQRSKLHYEWGYFINSLEFVFMNASSRAACPLLIRANFLQLLNEDVYGEQIAKYFGYSSMRALIDKESSKIKSQKIGVQERVPNLFSAIMYKDWREKYKNRKR